MAITLHSTTEFMKKFVIGSAIGIGAIIALVIFFNIGIVVKNILFPPKIDPANQAYGPLPALAFPESTIPNTFTYTIDTLDGTLPTFPDRIIIYPVINDAPNLLNLDEVKKKVTALEFVDNRNTTLPEIPRGGPMYEWQEPSGIQRKIIFDIVSLDFVMTSQYLQSLTVLNARNLGTEATAIAVVQGALKSAELTPADLDIEKTANPNAEAGYITGPQLYSITGGELIPTSSLSRAHAIRVDLYQKNIAYKLTAGTREDLTKFQDFEMDLPILYPQPPYSTMNFLVASGNSQAEIVAANFSHQRLNLEPEEQATYPIKTAEAAFEELKEGKGYIAAYNGNEQQILVREVYLGYFLGKDPQEYLMPVIVFEGPDSFFAYVSAVKDQALQ